MIELVQYSGVDWGHNIVPPVQNDEKSHNALRSSAWWVSQGSRTVKGRRGRESHAVPIEVYCYTVYQNDHSIYVKMYGNRTVQVVSEEGG